MSITSDDGIIHLHIHPFNETVSNHIRNTRNFFEIEFLMYIQENYRDQREIIDIGANIGNHSLFFAKFLNCQKVHCFEPVEANISILEKNLEPFGDRCIIYKMALSNKPGVMPLYNSQQENYGGFSLHSYSNGSSFPVNMNTNVATLDSFGFKNISMIKIDVENHEPEVLEGARQTILDNKPIIFIENLHHGYPHICPNPEPHQSFFHAIGYTKKEANIMGYLIDLWVFDGNTQ